MPQNKAFMGLLVSEGILTEKAARELERIYKNDTLEALLHLIHSSAAPKHVLGKLWGDSLNVAYVNLQKVFFQTQAVAKLPERFARKHLMIPIYELGGKITLATSDPTDYTLQQLAESEIGLSASLVFATPEEIEDAIEVQYQSDDSIGELIDSIAGSALFKGANKISVSELRELAGGKVVIDLCQGLMLLALKERATDIHIEPQENFIYIRFRIDGVLHDKTRLDTSFLLPLVSRLKILANLDITERRKPQDGRISVTLKSSTIDLRFSSIPTIYGEKITLRILGQIDQYAIPELSELNFANPVLNGLKRVAASPNGIFFVTGPTGSGKTTTLFSLLQHINTREINIMTVEDPVEYRLHGANQIQVSEAVKLDFASALRSFLRQDPDVMLIGEIRDLETAKIAARSALTGHLVLTTLHTNSALQAVIRLIEIGVEPYLVAPSMIGVMAQRLVRRICEHCKERYRVSDDEVDRYFIRDTESDVFFYRGKGCAECNHTGYLGRLGVHELCMINEEVRDLISKKASIPEITAAAKRNGFMMMRYDCMKKVLRGLTTIDELQRVYLSEE